MPGPQPGSPWIELAFLQTDQSIKTSFFVHRVPNLSIYRDLYGSPASLTSSLSKHSRPHSRLESGVANLIKDFQLDCSITKDVPILRTNLRMRYSSSLSLPNKLLTTGTPKEDSRIMVRSFCDTYYRTGIKCPVPPFHRLRVRRSSDNCRTLPLDEEWRVEFVADLKLTANCRPRPRGYRPRRN